VTLTSNQTGSYMCSTQRINMMKISGDLFQNPTKGSTFIERTRFVTDRRTGRTLEQT